MPTSKKSGTSTGRTSTRTGTRTASAKGPASTKTGTRAASVKSRAAGTSPRRAVAAGRGTGTRATKTPGAATRSAATRTRATRSSATRTTSTRGAASRSNGARSATTRSASSTTRRTSSTRQPEILTLLKKDHNEVKKMFKTFQQRIERNPDRAGDLGRQIIQELELHATLEERHVYPGLKEMHDDLFHEAEEEHHVAKLLMGELGTMMPTDPSYKAKMTVLQENVEHHIEEEEGDMFTQLRKLPNKRLMMMARVWKDRKESGIPASMLS